MAKQKKNLTLSDALVLHRFLLHQFGVTKFEALAEHLKDSGLEGFDENRVSNLHHALVARLYSNERLPKQLLFEYDQNIVSHTLAINEHRAAPIRWKYFQYLGLLFTEIYLDKYFRDKEALLLELNEFVDKFNDPFNMEVPNKDLTAPHFRLEELNKIAFWQATGSGKTLLMHVNIRQFQHYAKQHGVVKDISKVLLVTPNEGLTEQHLREFKESGIPAEVFSKRSASPMYAGQFVEVIEITKLADESGDKTVAVEFFEGNNLVLIDEGHRGVDGNQWKSRRDALSQAGFAFEYSATFGQAVSAATTGKGTLMDEYGKSILFDYSYRYFHADGYGKDFHILNIKDDDNEEFVRKYLTGGLLSFYQQQLIYRDNLRMADHFKLEKPLWVFVGGSVTKSLSSKDASDVITILKFFTAFIKDAATSKDHLQQILSGRDGLLDKDNISIFANAFTYINGKQFSADELYLDLLKTVFNVANPGANIYLDNLKGASGELGIRLGDTEDYFGVVNVGDDAKLHKLCIDHGIEGMEKDFSSSLFQGINGKQSSINLLIGSKKFTEGWSSWRVSTMGLMNIGRGEGSQIIQLFGRGVRLKGFGMSLKRSWALDAHQRPNEAIPKFIPALETLNIFGIRADYMQQFKQLLEDEGLPANDGKFVPFTIPVMPTVNLEEHKLKVVRVKEGIDFKKDKDTKKTRELALRLEHLHELPPVRLDWYPKVQVLDSKQSGNIGAIAMETHKLAHRNLAFINWEQVWFELQKFKYERTWYNLSISREALQEIMLDDRWYELSIPEEELRLKSYRQTRIWQEITVALLKNYTTRYYNFHKQQYLGEFLEVRTLRPDDPNFIGEYQVQVDHFQTQIIQNLEKLVADIKAKAMPQAVRLGEHFTAFEFLHHLYKPLLYLDEKKYPGGIIKIQPVALNPGEQQFVDDLKLFYEGNTDFFEGRKLFLLRNTSRKGIGYFETQNFYPDFILWLVEGEKQYIAFIDPKGLRQVQGFDSTKIRFHKTVKEKIEAQLNDPLISLSSHIVSNTSYQDVKYWASSEPMDYFNRFNVYFQQRNEQGNVYVGMVLRKMVG
jgi:Type III restriction enzyme, res subunit